MTESSERASPAKVLANLFQFALAVFAIGVPTLYAMGRVYLEAYWGALQLPQLDALALEDYVYLGFVASFNSAGRAMDVGTFGYLLIAGVVLTAFACYIVVLDKWLIPTIRKRLRDIGERVNISLEGKRVWIADLSRLVGVIWATLSTLAVLFFIAFIGIALPLVWMHRAGEQQASFDRKRLTEFGRPQMFTAEPILHYKDGEGRRRASLMLSCSEQWCVIFEDRLFAAVKTDAVERIDHCTHRVRLKNGAEICSEANAP